MNDIIQELFEQVGKVDHHVAILEDQREQLYRRIDEEYEKLELRQKSLVDTQNAYEGQSQSL